MYVSLNTVKRILSTLRLIRATFIVVDKFSLRPIYIFIRFLIKKKTLTHHTHMYVQSIKKQIIFTMLSVSNKCFTC